MMTAHDMKEEQAKSYKAFMEKSEIKELIALIRPNEHAPEALQSLLRAAFDHAYAMGTAAIILSMLKDSFKREP